MLPAWMALLLLITGVSRFLVLCDAQHHEAKVEVAHMSGHCDHDHAVTAAEEVAAADGSHVTSWGCDESPCNDLPLSALFTLAKSRLVPWQPPPAVVCVLHLPSAAWTVARLEPLERPPGPDPRRRLHQSVVLRI
jgi:hypothetical protein